MNRCLATFATTIVTTALALGSAHAASIRYDLDHTADFVAWETWAWKRPARPQTESIAESRIRRTLEAELGEKGYDDEAPGAADFLVDFYTGVKQEIELTETRALLPGRRLHLDTQTKGVLVVDVYDAETGRLAWRGAVSDTLASDPARAERRTQRAIEELLERFPSAGGP